MSGNIMRNLIKGNASALTSSKSAPDSLGNAAISKTPALLATEQKAQQDATLSFAIKDTDTVSAIATEQRLESAATKAPVSPVAEQSGYQDTPIAFTVKESEDVSVSASHPSQKLMDTATRMFTPYVSVGAPHKKQGLEKIAHINPASYAEGAGETKEYYTEQSERTQRDENTQKTIEAIIAVVSKKYRRQIASDGLSSYVRAQIEVTVSEEIQRRSLSINDAAYVKSQVMASITGLGVLEKFLADDEVTEIIVQRFNYILTLKRGLWEHVPEQFSSEQQLVTTIQRIVNPIGRQINLQTPIVDGRLKDGSRISAIIPPIAIDGATLTIRKFSNKMLSAEDCIKNGELSVVMLQFLQKCVEAKCNIIISGGTNTGKTTLLNMLSASIPQNEMIITIEDTCELKLKSPNVRRLETRKTEGSSQVLEKDLVKEALRMCPQRIIVGEIRDGAIIDMIGAMSTGHEGSMCTVHADSPKQLIYSRIPTLYSMADTSFSDATRNLQVGGAIDIIVQIGFDINNIRRITHITKVGKVTSADIKLEDIFRYNVETKTFEATGHIPDNIVRKCKARNIDMPRDMFKKTVKEGAEV